MGTKTMRTVLGVLAALSIATALPASGASAQEVQITGPLAGQPAVRRLRQYRQFRFFVTPSVAYTLQDEFSRALFFGGSIGFGFTDWLGISVWGAGAPLDIDTDLTSQIRSQGQVTDRNRLSLPSPEGFPRQVGRMRWGLAIQAVFIPLRGKLSIFQAGFVDTDLYVLGGVAIMGVDERAPVPQMNPCDPIPGMPGRPTDDAGCRATQTLASRVLPAPMIGVGLSMYITQWIGLQFEWRAFPFSWNPSGTDESGLDQYGRPGGGFPDGIIDGADSRTTFNHMFNVGVVIYLPTETSVAD
jgi:outer membrane beta-barrel protein